MKLIWIRLLLLLVSKEPLQTVMHVWSSPTTLCGCSAQQKCLLVRSQFPTWMAPWLENNNVCIHVSCVCVHQSPLVPPIVSLFTRPPFLEWESRTLNCCQSMCLIFCVNSTYSKDQTFLTVCSTSLKTLIWGFIMDNLCFCWSQHTVVVILWSGVVNPALNMLFV